MIYLLRVGVDTTAGKYIRELKVGFLSPIFEDNSYLFIPYPDDRKHNYTCLPYAEYFWNKQSVLPYIPEKIRDLYAPYPVHNDPEFISCTYGAPIYLEPKKERFNPRYIVLKDLQENDLLVFYAGFQDPQEMKSGYYFFAYFLIQKAVSYSDPDLIPGEEKRLVGNNHHYIQGWTDVIVIVGNPHQSRVFEKAVLLSSKETDRDGANYYPNKRIKKYLGGYDSSLNMSSIRHITSPTLKVYLDKNSGSNLLDTGYPIHSLKIA